jgi:hypothetical protein
MAVLTNPKHEKFAQAVAKGSSAAEAYRKTYPRASDSTAETTGPALLRDSQISLRVSELRKAGADLAKERVAYEIADAVEFCVKVIQAKPSEAGPDNPLSEIKMSKAGPYFAFPDKRACLDLLSKLKGWYAPEKSEVDVRHSVSPAVEAALSKLLA